MNTIQINVVGKRAQTVGEPVIVCGNSDYKINFAFDDEWAKLKIKTARFSYKRNGEPHHLDIVFEGDMVDVPKLSKIREVEVGLFAGDLVTTTPAVIPCELSILCSGGVPDEPSEDVYSQIMELFNKKVIDPSTPIDQVFDPESENAQSGKALADLEKGTIKVITEPCHIAELEKGTYIVKNDFVGEYNGKVTIANIKTDGETIDDDYFALKCGLLVVFENIKQNEEDGTETSIIGFTAQGMITVPNQSYTGDFLKLQQTIKNATSIQGYLLRSFRTTESAEPVEPNKWYSQMPEIVMSDIPVTAMISEITEESTLYDFPNAVAIREYVKEQLGVIDNGRY